MRTGALTVVTTNDDGPVRVWNGSTARGTLVRSMPGGTCSANRDTSPRSLSSGNAACSAWCYEGLCYERHSAF